MAFPPTLSGTLAQSGTPDSNQTEIVPTETTAPEPTDVPVEPTDVPAEPTATETLVPPTATEPPVSPTVADEPTQTATSETELKQSVDSDVDAAVAISSIFVSFEVCEDDDRVGTDNLGFDGSFSAAETAIQCAPVNGVNLDVTLTDVDGVNGPYTLTIPAGSANATFPFGSVEDGTYDVSYAPTAAASFSGGSFAEQIVLDDPNEAYRLEIQVFIAEDEDPAPLEPGVGSISGDFLSCRDVERDGETDFLVDGFTTSGEADLCEESPFDAQIQLTISGTDADDNPVGPFTENVLGGQFEFPLLPFGTYTITESVYGNSSEQFVHGNNSFGLTTISIRNFFAVEPAYGVSFVLNVQGCSDPERAGTVDYLVTDVSGFGPADTCTENFFPAGAPFEITIFGAGGEVFGPFAISSTFTSAFVPGLTAGTYTMQLTGAAVSTPFTVEADGAYDGRVVIYDDSVIDPGVPDPEGNAEISGNVLYCTAPDISNTTQYLIRGGFVPVSTSECVDAPTNTGLVYLYQYENSGDDVPIETTILPVNGATFTTLALGEPTPSGYYRIGYAPTSFSTPTNLSDEFVPTDFPGTEIEVRYYGDVDPTSTLILRKDICTDVGRDGTTDFFVQQEPIGGLSATDETITCRVATIFDGPYSFTLTNTDSGESTVFVSETLPVVLGGFFAVPAGTYILTEVFIGGTRTSSPFEVVPSGGDYSVIVRNYTTEDEPTFEGDGSTLLLWAYDCVSSEKAGTSEWYYNPGIVGDAFDGGGFPFPGGGPLGEASDFSAASTETCVPAEQYSFAIDDGTPDVGAAAIFPLIPNPESPYVHATSADGELPGPVPSNEYVIMEALTGSVSDPINLQYPINVAAFYRYQAEPTPTPSPTATSTPVPTATVTPTVDPSVTATVTPTIDPSVTATATATSVPTESGSAVITVETNDGSEIPDGTSVCLNGDCQFLDATASLVAAAAPSGTQVAFTDLAPGVYPLTAFIGDDQVFAGTIEIVAGQAIDVTITLQIDPSGSPVPVEPTTPADPDATTAPVSSLPSTGSGADGATSMTLAMLLGGIVLITAAFGWRRRTR